MATLSGSPFAPTTNHSNSPPTLLTSYYQSLSRANRPFHIPGFALKNLVVHATLLLFLLQKEPRNAKERLAIFFTQPFYKHKKQAPPLDLRSTPKQPLVTTQPTVDKTT